MKKFLATMLAATMIFTLAACSGNNDKSSSSSESPSSEAAITGPDDLVGKKIGVQLGTTGAIYAEDIEDAEVELFNKGFEAVQSLAQGKLDAVILDDEVAKALTSQTEGVMILDNPFTEEDYALCVSKDNAALTASINTAIAELKADGTLDAILDKYINKTEGAAGYTTPEGTTYPNGTLVMATNAQFPPYEYYEGEEIVGVDAEFAKAICDKLGYELKIEDMEFDAIIAAVQSGKAQFGAAGMTVTEDRLKSIDFTDTYCHASQVIIVKK